jgi:hypothetical protein
MSKRAVPQVPPGDLARVNFDKAIKENLERVTGQQGGRIKRLPDSASLADVIAKVNEIIEQLQ